MATQLQLNERKASLLAAVIKINTTYRTEEGKIAITMLRTTKECDKRVISRNARGIKDPEPLATTMLLMAKKTPFLAREDKLACFTEQEKKEALSTYKDARVQGRVYCSKRAFDIWLSKPQQISEHTMSIINVRTRCPSSMCFTSSHETWWLDFTNSTGPEPASKLVTYRKPEG